MLTSMKGFLQQLVVQGALALLALFLDHLRALVGVDQTRRGRRGWVVGYLPDSLPCLATVVSQISGRDDLLPFGCIKFS